MDEPRLNEEDKRNLIKKIGDNKLTTIPTSPSPSSACSFCGGHITNVMWVLQDRETKRIYTLHEECYDRAIMLSYPTEGRK